MSAPMPTLLVLIGPPGAGKTTTAKNIMMLREKELRRPLRGEVLSVDHPDGERNKKGTGVKQVGAGVVLDGRGGLALLGRYATTHPKFWKTTRNKQMEGADRLAVGKEKGTWSQLLRPGVSPLADYRLLIIDSCDEATLHTSHLRQAHAAGWVVRVRELVVDCDTSRDRCMERNYAGRSSSDVEPRLTSMEHEWNEAFDEKVALLRARFRAWDYAMRSQDEVLQEATTLLAGMDSAASSATLAAPAAPAATKRASQKRRSRMPANGAKKRTKHNRK
jgi:ABC-type dipeptide/oligopeptide/nickel transport system ATPase component|eukprot:COSAG02_NODE_1884_length_10516_cov_4.173466_14_plen_276_part_00